MATAKELRAWANLVREWATKMEDIWARDLADSLSMELERIAHRQEVLDRELV
jgi:hypothetical protein